VVGAEPLPLGGDVAAEALDLVRRYSRSELSLRLPDGTTRKVRPAALGAEIDRVRLADFVQAAWIATARSAALTSAGASASRGPPLPCRSRCASTRRRA